MRTFRKWLFHFIVLFLIFNVFDFFTKTLIPDLYDLWNLNYASIVIQNIYDHIGNKLGYDPDKVKFPKVDLSNINIQRSIKDIRVQIGDRKNVYSSEIALNGSIIIEEAKKHLGKTYKRGATGPDHFDCSGFAYYVYNEIGIDLPRPSNRQVKLGTRVSGFDLQPGDLLFFRERSSLKPVSHVAIFYGKDRTGEELVIHANKPGGSVRLEKLKNLSGYLTSKRFIN